MQGDLRHGRSGDKKAVGKSTAFCFPNQAKLSLKPLFSLQITHIFK